MDRRMGMTLDAADPRALGALWALALGYVEDAPPDGFADWPSALVAWGVPREVWDDFYALVDPDGAGLRFFLQRVPEGKTAKNRLHLDIRVPGARDATTRPGPQEVRAFTDRLVSAGARVVREHDDPSMGFWIVLQDPEGNEFCAV